jgi:hypothetical protein
MNLLIIHKDVPDIPFIISNVLPEIQYIIVDLENDNLKNIIKDIQKIYKDKNLDKIENIGIVRHNINPAFIQKLSTQDIEKRDPELDTWIKFSSFLFRLTKLGCKNVDLISCNCYTDDWKYIINYYKNKYGINIRSSVNITGAGGDWILESDNIDLVNLYFYSDIVHYKYSLVSVSAPYDVVLVRNYDSGKYNYDVLCGYGKNNNSIFGIENENQIFTEYSILSGTSERYPSYENPVTSFASSYMTTLFKAGQNFIASGNKIRYVNNEYTMWQNYFETEYPFSTQTRKEIGGSVMTKINSFKNTQVLNNVKYYEIGISSPPQLTLFANEFEDVDLAAAALAKQFGFGWAINKKYEEWYDWFEESPLMGSISYADRMLIEASNFLNSKEFMIISIVLTIIITIATMGSGAVLAGITTVLKTLATKGLQAAFKTAWKLICNAISAAIKSTLKKVLTFFTRNASDDATVAVTANLSTRLANSFSKTVVELSKYIQKKVTDYLSKFTYKEFKRISEKLINKGVKKLKEKVADEFKGRVEEEIKTELNNRLNAFWSDFNTDVSFVEVETGKPKQPLKRGIVNQVIPHTLNYINKPGKPLHKDMLLKPRNTYTQNPTNDGYFFVYLTKEGEIWVCGDNTHGQIGEKIFNLQENYGAGMPKQFTNVINRKKVELYEAVLALLLVSSIFFGGIAVAIAAAIAVALAQLLLSAGTAYLRPLGGGAYPIITKLNIPNITLSSEVTDLVSDVTSDTPPESKVPIKIIHVSCGDGYLIALDNYGNLYATGKNLYYQIPGKEDYYSLFGLTALPLPSIFIEMKTTIKHVICGPNHVVLMSNMPGNELYVTGDSTYGQGGIIDDPQFTYDLNHLIDKKTGTYGVKTTLVGLTPLRLFIPNNEVVLQVCCGLKCTVILTELRNVYVYGFGYEDPRKIYLPGGVSLTILNTYISPDISNEINDASNNILNGVKSMSEDQSEENIKQNVEKITKITDNTFTTIDYPSGTNIINYTYFDISTNMNINITATKIGAEWDLKAYPDLDHISLSINETSSNVNSSYNIPKFIKVIDDTIILYCTNDLDTFDNIVHVDATNINITANEVKIENILTEQESRIIPGIFYFGHSLTLMMSLGYKFNDLNTYYEDELNALLASSEFDTVEDFLDFGVDLLSIIKYDKFTAQQFKNAGISFKKLFNTIYDVATLKVNVESIVDANWKISDYLGAGLKFKDLWTNVTFRNLKNKFTIYDYIKEGIPIKELLQECPWLTAKDFFNNNRTAKELYDGGFNVIEILDASYSIFDLYNSKIPIYEIPKSLNIPLFLIILSGYTLMEIFDAKYCSATELKLNNISIDDIYSLKLEDIKAGGYTLNELINSPNSIYYTNSIEDFINAGYSLSDLKKAQVHVIQVVYYMNIMNSRPDLPNKITLKDIRDAGYTVNELKPFNYQVSELKKAGYTVEEMREANYSVRQLKVPNGYTDIELLEGGFSLFEVGLNKSSLNVVKYNNKFSPYNLLKN